MGPPSISYHEIDSNGHDVRLDMRQHVVDVRDVEQDDQAAGLTNHAATEKKIPRKSSTQMALQKHNSLSALYQGTTSVSSSHESELSQKPLRPIMRKGMPK